MQAKLLRSSVAGSGADRMSSPPIDLPWRIVASQQMHRGPVPYQRGGFYRSRFGSAGDGGTWVYVAWPNTCVVVQPQHHKSLGVWHRMRMMRLDPVAHYLVPGVSGGRVENSRHVLFVPDVDGILAAIERLRDHWLMPLPVDWRVIRDVPRAGCMPCEWTSTHVPIPASLLPQSIDDGWS